jgi:hypothetical protein
MMMNHSNAVAWPTRTVRLDEHDLAAMLRTEDAVAGLSVFDRVTCPFHRTWAHRCISSPTHVIPLTGHRWCADCRIPADVAVDELTGRVSVTCGRCGRPPRGFATQQIVRACQASLARARRGPTAAANSTLADRRAA